MRAREVATAMCARLCMSHDLQFLDGSVSLVALRLARTPEGRLRFARVYQFEYSLAGYDREKGRLGLLGARIVHLEFDPPSGVTLRREA